MDHGMNPSSPTFSHSCDELIIRYYDQNELYTVPHGHLHKDVLNCRLFNGGITDEGNVLSHVIRVMFILFFCYPNVVKAVINGFTYEQQFGFIILEG